MDRKEKMELIEEILKVTFPHSYREFLLEKGSAIVRGFKIFGLGEKEKEEGVLLCFVRSDPKKGGFLWISHYQGRVVGLCNLPNCPQCNSREREKLKNFKGGELRVNLSFYQRKEFYVAHLISVPEKFETPKMSVLEATEILRALRPDLPRNLVAIAFHEDHAFCLDLRENPKEDCPFVEVNLTYESPIWPTNKTFKEWLTEGEKEDKRFLAARQRIKNRENEIRERVIKEVINQRFGSKCPICEKEGRKGHLTCSQCFQNWRKESQVKEIELIDWVEEKLEAKGVKVPKFTHVGGQRRIYIRPQDWDCRIVRYKDYVIMYTAFRYNSRENSLEVDEFWTYPHPHYPPGEITRNLAIRIFSAAYHLGGSLNVIFTRDIREDEETGKIRDKNWRNFLSTLSPEFRKEAEENHGRVHRPIPQELKELAKRYGVTFKEAERGKIHHNEGVELFFRLFEFPPKVEEKINELVGKGYFTKEALCFIVAAGIWNLEEVIWLFLNAPRPEAVILGTDTPENRLLHSESVNWGRSVYLASLLKRKIELDLSGGISEEEKGRGECVLEPKENFWILQANQEFYLPWQIKGLKPVLVKPKEPVLILSRPQQTSQPADDLAWLKEKIEFLAKMESEAKIRCLLLSFEFSDLKYGMKVSEEMKAISQEAAEKGVYLLFSPYKLDILNDEVEERMARARRLKHFESRSAPLKLRVIEVPREVWQEPALKFSVEDALSAASWIAKRIDLRLGRIRFRTNCQVIERIAIQDPRNKIIEEFEGKESEELQMALKTEQGITLPFVQPEKMPEFIRKLGGKLKSTLAQVQGGIVVVVPPYEKSAAEPKVTPLPKPVIISVPADFQFPVDPENIDYSRYQQGYRRAEIKRFHEQIQQSLRTGQPLAVSYLPHELFPEVMRDYIYYTPHPEHEKKSFLFFKRLVKSEKREPPEPVLLRIVYQDGTEGTPFPLFCLSKLDKPLESTNFYELKMGSISMRHVNLDLITEGYLMTNMMMKRKGREGAAAQEDYAFRTTWHFLTNFVDLIQHKRVEEIIQEVRFRFLWNWLKEIREKRHSGLKLHIFQTGLEPAVVGMYRAVVEFLRQRRGELIVVPRLISDRELRKLRKEKGITEDAYIKTAEWF